VAVAKVIEITSSSSEIVKGVAKASESVRDNRVEGGKIVENRADLKVTFVLE
jgi:hypothetical protein